MTASDKAGSTRLTSRVLIQPRPRFNNFVPPFGTNLGPFGKASSGFDCGYILTMIRWITYSGRWPLRYAGGAAHAQENEVSVSSSSRVIVLIFERSMSMNPERLSNGRIFAPLILGIKQPGIDTPEEAVVGESSEEMMVESKVGKTQIDNKLTAYTMPVIRLDNEELILSKVYLTKLLGPVRIYYYSIQTQTPKFAVNTRFGPTRKLQDFTWNNFYTDQGIRKHATIEKQRAESKKQCNVSGTIGVGALIDDVGPAANSRPSALPMNDDGGAALAPHAPLSSGQLRAQCAAAPRTNRRSHNPQLHRGDSAGRPEQAGAAGTTTARVFVRACPGRCRCSALVEGAHHWGKAMSCRWWHIRSLGHLPKGLPTLVRGLGNRAEPEIGIASVLREWTHMSLGVAV
ncbi:hypothetical protein BJ912DRAFT_1093790 [Pholiota molesta]|nr:hypothetical protein BJ912DRAFT_1093790 [Pholiota molesta]